MWEWPSSIWVSFLIAPFHVTTPLKIRPYGATEISLLLLFFVSIMFGHTPHIYHGQLKCKYVCCNVSNVKSIFRIVLLARIMSNLLLVSPYRVSTAVISQYDCAAVLTLAAAKTACQRYLWHLVTDVKILVCVVCYVAVWSLWFW